MSGETVFLQVVDAYDQWSQFYDSYDNPMVFGATRIVERLAGQVAGRDVVELGAAPGVISPV